MKALKFCFLLLGLCFLTNETVKAQLQFSPIEVEMAAENSPLHVTGVQQMVNITVTCNANVTIFVDVCPANNTNGPLQACNTQLINGPTTYQFSVVVPPGSLAKCGYIDANDEKHFDGSCSIPVEPG